MPNLNSIIADKVLLTQILMLHTVVGSAINAGALKEGHVVTTASGDLTFNKVGSGWRITAPGSTAMIITADVDASNGIVHVIDGVLLPAPKPQNIVGLASSVDYLSTLVTAVKAAGLVSTLSSTGPFTVFAPNNAAFAKVKGLDAILSNAQQLKEILLLHAVAGSAIRAQNLKEGHIVTTASGDLTFNKVGAGWRITAPGSTAMIITADVDASNGIVHVIDGVLLPDMSAALENIVQVASTVASLSTLVTAVKAAGLVGTLSGSGPMTVLAPSNAAFDQIPDLDKILGNKAQLTEILLLHVFAAQKLMSSDLQDGLTAGSLTFTMVAGGWQVTSPGSTAMITKSDVGASNGVVHLIDGVLLPAMDARSLAKAAESRSCQASSCTSRSRRRGNRHYDITPIDAGTNPFAAFNIQGP